VKNLQDKVYINSSEMLWIDYARIISAFAVIIIHVSASKVTTTVDINSYVWLIGNFYDSFSRWSVPVFIMASGALLLNPKNKSGIIDFYRKRASRILIPLVFWTLFYTLYSFFMRLAAGKDIEIINLFKQIVLGRPYYHLWFLYMILFLYLFTPFIKKLICCFSEKEIIFICVLMFAIAAVITVSNRIYFKRQLIRDTMFFGWFITYLPYYLSGYLISILEVKRFEIINALSFILFSLATAVGCYLLSRYTGLEIGLYFYDYLCITVILAAISAFCLFKGIAFNFAPKQVKKVSSLTLGIYLVHPVGIDILNGIDLSPYTCNDFLFIPLISAILFIFSALTITAIRSIPYIRRVV
jgi:surface polysaccharide O-acyltransferase-like enzyme